MLDKYGLGFLSDDSVVSFEAQEDGVTEEDLASTDETGEDGENQENADQTEKETPEADVTEGEGEDTKVSEEPEEPSDDTEENGESEDTVNTDKEDTVEEREPPIRVPTLREELIKRFDPTGMKEHQPEKTEEALTEVKPMLSAIPEDDAEFTEVHPLKDEVDKVQDIADEALAHLGEQATRLDQDVIRLNTVEEIQKRFQSIGVSRPDVVQLGQLSGRGERMIDERGVALESFTLFPSRTNYQYAIEASKSTFFAIIGGIVYYVLKAIYYVFKVIAQIIIWIGDIIEWLSSIFSGETKKASKIDKMINIVKSSVKSNELYAERLRENEELSHVIESISEHWTELLDTVVLGKSDDIKTVYKLFNDIPDMGKNVEKLYDSVKKVTSELKQHMSDGQKFKNYIEDNVVKIIDEYDKQSYHDEIESVSYLFGQMKQLAENKMVFGIREVEQMISSYEEHNNVFNEFMKLKKPDEKSLSTKILDDIQKHQEELEKILNTPVEGLEVEEAKELADKVKQLMRVFKYHASNYLNVSKLYHLVGMQWRTFVTKRSTLMRRFTYMMKGIAADVEDDKIKETLETLLNELKEFQGNK